MILLQLLVMVLTVITLMDGHENLVPAKSGKKNQDLDLTMKPILQVLERKKAACNSKKCKSCKKGCNHCKLCKVPATTPPTTATIEPAPGLPGTTCTESFNSIKVTGKKRKKTYKFICDFVMVYTNEAVKTSKSSVKCEGPSKVPQGLSAKVILIGDDGLMFTLTISLKPLSINIATVNGAKCNPAPEGKPCKDPNGELLQDGSMVTLESGIEIECCKGRWITLYNTPFVDSSLVVTGGRDENGNFLASSEIITSEGVCLTSIPPLPVTLFGASSVYFDGSLMVCGGRNNGDQNKCYLLDSSTSTWKTGPQMNRARIYFTLTKVGGAVYAVGGWNGGKLDSMEKLEGTSWTFLPQKMSSATNNHCTVNIGNQLVVIGGLTAAGLTDKVESFDVSSGQWTPLEPLPLKLRGHKCTTFKEAIYVSGGFSPFSNKVFMYQDGSWSTAGEMEVARAWHMMGVVDGKLLVAGGYNGTIALDSVETIDEQGQWKKLQWTVSKRYVSAMSQVPRDKFPCNP